MSPCAVGKDERVAGSSWPGKALAKVLDTSNQAEDRTKGRVAGPGMANGLVADAVLLGRERERREHGGEEIGVWARQHVKFAGPNPQAHILKAKQVVALLTRKPRVFARSQQEIEADDKAIRGAERKGGAVGLCEADGDMHQLQGKGVDACGRGVSLFPCAQEGGEAKVKGSELVQTRVRGPQPGKRLPHTSQGVFHGARSDGATAGGKSAGAVSLGEELQNRDAIPGAI